MILIPITRLKFEEAKVTLARKGVTFRQTQDADTGTAEYSGVKVSFSFKEARESLAIVVLARPFLAPMSKVEAAIRGWFDSPPPPPSQTQTT